MQRTFRTFLGPQISGGWVKNFQFGLVCPDPASYSQEIKTSAQISVNGAAVDVYNGGLRNTYPLLRVYGAVTNPVINNITTGKSISLTYTIADGRYVDILHTLETITLDTGTGLLDKLNVASSEFFPMQPGLNTFTVTGSSVGANAKVFVIRRDAW
jgi:phage-related protein